MASAAPAEDVLVACTPSLCPLGLLMNLWQILVTVLHLLARMLETCSTEVGDTLAFLSELQFYLCISQPARWEGAPGRLHCDVMNVANSCLVRCRSAADRDIMTKLHFKVFYLVQTRMNAGRSYGLLDQRSNYYYFF